MSSSKRNKNISLVILKIYKVLKTTYVSYLLPSKAIDSVNGSINIIVCKAPSILILIGVTGNSKSMIRIYDPDLSITNVKIKNMKKFLAALFLLVCPMSRQEYYYH